MQTAEHLDHLERVVAALVATTSDADPSTAVPTCGSWDIAKLLKHVGTVHRWSTAMVAELAPKRIDPRTLDLEIPGDVSDYPSWIAAGAQTMLTTLRAVDPDAPMFAWGADQHARFWARRMLHETVVHHADVQLAIGVEPSIPAEIALDTVDEFLDNLASAAGFNPEIANLAGDGVTIHLHATDAPGEWMIERTPDGFTYAHGHGKGDVALRGPISDLALWMYARRSWTEAAFETFGDTALLDHWIANSAL